MKYFLAGAYLLFGLSLFLFYLSKKGVDEPSRENLLAVLPCAERFEKVDNYWAGFETNGKLCGYAFFTASFPPKVKGYGGEIHAVVGMDTKGVITGIEILRHNETPFYFGLLEEAGFFQDLKGHRIEDGYKGIPLVAGATVSSRALMKDVIGGAVKIARERLGIKPEIEEEGLWREKILSSFIFLVFLLGFLGVKLRKRFLFWISSISSLFLIGVYLNASFSLTDISRIFSSLPSPENLSVIILYFSVLLTAVIRPPLYCRCICPYGTLVEVAGKVGKAVKIESPAVARFASFFREFMGVTLLSLFFLTGASFFLYVEPFQWFFSFKGSFIMWVFALCGILLSLFVKRFWCIFLCPTGGILNRISSIFSRLPHLLKLQRNF